MVYIDLETSSGVYLRSVFFGPYLSWIKNRAGNSESVIKSYSQKNQFNIKINKVSSNNSRIDQPNYDLRMQKIVIY